MVSHSRNDTLYAVDARDQSSVWISAIWPTGIWTVLPSRRRGGRDL